MGVLRRIAAKHARRHGAVARNVASDASATDSADPSTGAFTGAWVFLFSLVFFLFAVGVFPADDSTFGAPRWAVAVLLLAPMLCGLGLMAPAAGWPSIGPALLHGGGLLFVTSMAVFCAWLVLTGRTGSHGMLSVSGIPIPLPRVVARLLNQLVVSLAALMFAGIGVAYWTWAIKAIGGGERPPTQEA